MLLYWFTLFILVVLQMQLNLNLLQINLWILKSLECLKPKLIEFIYTSSWKSNVKVYIFWLFFPRLIHKVEEKIQSLKLVP